jgi:hypothetical protein
MCVRLFQIYPLYTYRGACWVPLTPMKQNSTNPNCQATAATFFLLRWHLIILYTQYRTPFVLLFWRLELWGGFWISEKVVHPFDKVTSRKWLAVYCVSVSIFAIWYLQSFCPMKVNVTHRERSFLPLSYIKILLHAIQSFVITIFLCWNSRFLVILHKDGP